MIFLLLFHLILIFIGGYFLSPEFTVYPYLTSHGFIPYINLIDQHLPIIFFGPFSLPLWLVANRTILLGLFITLLLATDTFFYLAIRQTRQPLFFTFTFIIFSWFFGGNFFWLSTFITFFLSLFLFLKIYSPKSIQFILGFLIGLIFLIKPTLLPGLSLLLFYSNLTNPFILTGFLSPIVVTLLYLIKLDALDSFYNLIFTFNTNYYVPFAHQLPNQRQLLLVLLAFIIPLYFLIQKNKKSLLISLLFLTLIYPRFEYLHLGPFVLLLTYFVANLKLNPIQISILTLVTALFFSFSLIKLKNYRYGDFYFNEEIVQANKNVKNLPGQNLLILGGSELIYPLSGKTPPEIYIPPLPWYFAVSEYQNQFLSSLAKTKTPILYYPSASVDNQPITAYTDFLIKILETNYNKEVHENYYLYLPK